MSVLRSEVNGESTSQPSGLSTPYEALFQLMPIAAYTWKRVGEEMILVDYNLLARDRTQGRILEWLGTSSRRMFDDAPEITEMMERCLRERRSLQHDMLQYRLRSTGDKVDLQISYTFIHPDVVVVYTEDITERLRSEKAVRESERNYRLLFECAADAIVIAGTEGLILDANPMAAAMLGYTIEEMRGRMRISDLVPAEDLADEPAIADDVIAGANIVRERRMRHRSGSIFPAEINAAPLPGQRMIAIIRDLSQIRAAEEESHRTATLLTRVLESLPVGVWVFDRFGHVTLANPAGQKLRGDAYGGFGRYAARWQETGERVRPDEWPVLLTLRTGRQMIDCAMEIEIENGERRNLIVSTIPLRSPDGAIHGAIAVLQDVTDQYVAQDALRRSEEQYRLLIENVSDVVVVLTANGAVRFVSPSIEPALGYAPSEITGRMLTEILEPEDAPLVNDVFRQLRIDATETLAITVRLRHRDGSIRVLDVVARGRVVHREDMGDTTVEMIATARDVTDRKLLSAQLEQAERLSSLGRLAATIAHEMNNVLMGIQPFGELIQRRTMTMNDDVLQNASQQIRRSVQRGRRVTQEILRFSNPKRPALQPFDANELFESIIPEARGLLGPNITLRFVPLRKPVHLLGDREQMSQVVTNLLLNARDAIGGTGTVEITLGLERHDATFRFGIVRDPHRFLHVRLCDDGSGIPQDVLPHIFEPLFTTKRAGTGLGLAVVHQCIVQHGGEIFAESRAGVGTTFHLFLPLITASAVDIPATPPVPVPTQRRVLLVEDEPSVALGTSALLEMEGFVVSLVGTGHEAMEAISIFHPDVVVLDVGLPDMSGLDLHDMIAERWPALPVIVSTGHGDDVRVREHRASGRQAGFLLKPYGIDELLGEIGRVTKV